MRRTSRVIAGVVTVLAVVGTSASAQETATEVGCEGMFPDVEWTSVHAAFPVTIRAEGVTRGLADRYTNDLRAGIDLIQPELGGLDDVEVCLFADELPLDSIALGWPVGQRLRAASFAPEGVVVLSAWNIGLVKPAGILGLAHQALWQRSDGTYPEPLGGAVAQWYVARVTNRLERYHSNMRFANLVEPFDPIPWTAGTVESLMLWNPEFQESAIGDFVDFAVQNNGIEVIRSPDATTLEVIQAEWQRRLLIEARGSDEPTRGWIFGAAIVAGSILLAAALAFASWRIGRGARVRSAERTIPVEPAER